MEGASTIENSPIKSRAPARHRYSDPRHTVQCTCDLERHNFISRGYYSLTSKSNFKSCWRSQEWLKSLDACSVEDFEALMSSPLETDQFADSIKQIDLDLARTYPDEPYFSKGSGQIALRRCLLAFSKYDMKLGYVQGMNFIMASLLWHSTEVDAFWLFVRLMEYYELRDTYLPSLPGLSKHSQIIQLLLIDYLPKVYTCLAEHRIGSEVYAAEWCFTLFASAIPPSQIHHILDHFFQRGWGFFYRFVVTLLQCLEKKLVKANDPLEVLFSLKVCNRPRAENNEFLEVLGPRMTWLKLTRRALALYIDESYINQLHLCFNIDTARFTIKP